jgi:hypothetical protein
VARLLRWPTRQPEIPASYALAEADLDDVLSQLFETDDPVERAELLDALGTCCIRLAGIERDTFSGDGHAMADQRIEDAAVTLLLADIERARASSRPRYYRGRSFLDHVASNLLDQLAEPRINDGTRGNIHGLVAVKAEQALPCPAEPFLFRQLADWYAHRAHQRAIPTADMALSDAIA